MARELTGLNPSAAASLEEGLEDTLTLHRLGLPEVLRVSLRSTNLIESLFSVARQTTGRVKRWRNSDQVWRRAGSGLLEAEKTLRRIKGYADMSVLLRAWQFFRASLGARVSSPHWGRLRGVMNRACFVGIPARPGKIATPVTQGAGARG